MLTQSTDRVHAMQEPATAQWGLSISDADLEKLDAGLEPQDSDDKWLITVTDQNQSSTHSIHWARSGTNTELYVLHVKPSGGGGSSGSGSGAKVEAITWEQNNGGVRISEEQAKKEIALLSRRVLECEFGALPEYDSSIMWDHPGANIDESAD